MTSNFYIHPWPPSEFDYWLTFPQIPDVYNLFSKTWSSSIIPPNKWLNALVMQTKSLGFILDPSFSLTPAIQPSPNPKSLMDPSPSLLTTNKKSPSYPHLFSALLPWLSKWSPNLCSYYPQKVAKVSLFTCKSYYINSFLKTYHIFLLVLG